MLTTKHTAGILLVVSSHTKQSFLSVKQVSLALGVPVNCIVINSKTLVFTCVSNTQPIKTYFSSGQTQRNHIPGQVHSYQRRGGFA